MKILIRKQEYTVTAVEVTFPIYSQMELYPEDGDSQWWMRRTETRFESVHYRTDENGKRTWEIETERWSPKHPVYAEPDYVLGKGRHACTAEQFDAALARARTALDAIGVSQ